MRRSFPMLTLALLAACAREAPAPPPAAEGQTPMTVSRATFQVDKAGWTQDALV